MEDGDEPREASRKFRQMLKAAGYKSRRAGTGYAVLFGGRYRSWEFQTSLRDGWFSLSGYVMSIPDLAGRRAALYECLATVNERIPLVKFTRTGDMLTVELQYREEHLDPAVLGRLLGLMHSICEEQYPSLFRTVAAEEQLSALEDAYHRPSLTGGAD